RMLWTGGIAWRRTDSFVTFLDQGLIIEAFFRVIAPDFLSYPLMEVFCPRFCKPIRHSFQHDDIVIISFAFEFGQLFFDSKSCGYGKAAKIISQARMDKIYQRAVRYTFPLLSLLSQEMKLRQLIRGIRRKNAKIIFLATGGIDSNHSFGLKPFF